MAEFNPAIEYVFHNEGGYEKGQANYGLTLPFLKGLIDNNISHGEPMNIEELKKLRGDQAKIIYKIHCWDANNFSAFSSQMVATKLFDMSVNMGVYGAHHIANKCLSTLDRNYSVLKGTFSKFSTPTIQAINKINPHQLTTCLVNESINHYKAIGAHAPEKRRFLKTWLKRAVKRPDIEDSPSKRH